MGRVAAPYGVRGWIKVLPLTAEAETLLGYGQWWVRRRGGARWQEHALESGRQHGATLLAQLSGLLDREAAAALTGADVGVARAALPATKENEYYWSELAGLTVVNRQGVVLGAVREVAEFGAHPVLRVDGADGTQRLIPFVEAYVDGVDLPGKRIDVDWQPEY